MAWDEPGVELEVQAPGLPSGNRNSTAKATKGKKPRKPRHVVSVWLCPAPPRRAGGPVCGQTLSSARH